MLTHTTLYQDATIANALRLAEDAPEHLPTYVDRLIEIIEDLDNQLTTEKDTI
jgi:hypothetical protein